MTRLCTPTVGVCIPITDVVSPLGRPRWLDVYVRYYYIWIFFFFSTSLINNISQERLGTHSQDTAV